MLRLLLQLHGYSSRCRNVGVKFHFDDENNINGSCLIELFDCFVRILDLNLFALRKVSHFCSVTFCFAVVVTLCIR